MNPRLLVIADDLTGALDTGVQFARVGVPANVVTHRRFAEGLRSGAVPVLVVDTESRHLPADRAGLRVAACVRAARARGVERYYKKTDSTLRGNVGAELEALVAAAGGRELCFVPALPKAGRTTRSGVQFVDGIPLHVSSFAHDARDPVRGTSVEAIIRSQSRIPVATVGRGEDPVRVLAGHGRPIILVFDAESDEDLESIAGLLAASGMARLIAGCSGFAEFLPRLHGLPSRPRRPAALRSPLLLLSASLHRRSLDQLREAELHDVPSLRIDPLLAANARWRRSATRTVARLLQSRGTAIVGCRHESLAPPRQVEAMLRHLGRLARDLVDRASVRTIAVFGGDTASAVVESLRLRSLEPVSELCQGVVVSRAGSNLHLITKAGGFGPIDVIERIAGSLDQGA